MHEKCGGAVVGIVAIEIESKLLLVEGSRFFLLPHQ